VAGRESVPGPGGLAGKAVYSRYQQGGTKAIENLSGNCVLLVSDPARGEFHVVTDCAGAYPAFRLDSAGPILFASHPDVLAAAAGESSRRDEVSLRSSS